MKSPLIYVGTTESQIIDLSQLNYFKKQKLNNLKELHIYILQ